MIANELLRLLSNCRLGDLLLLEIRIHNLRLLLSLVAILGIPVFIILLVLLLVHALIRHRSIVVTHLWIDNARLSGWVIDWVLSLRRCNLVIDLRCMNWNRLLMRFVAWHIR